MSENELPLNQKQGQRRSLKQYQQMVYTEFMNNENCLCNAAQIYVYISVILSYSSLSSLL